MVRAEERESNIDEMERDETEDGSVDRPEQFRLKSEESPLAAGKVRPREASGRERGIIC